MTTPATHAVTADARVARSLRAQDRWFYSGMALAIGATVFAGFAPTYYLRPYFHPEPLRPLLQLHGIVFTFWILLFLAQTGLVAAGRTDLHRRMGLAAFGLVPLMVVVGATTAIVRAKEGLTPPGGPPPLVFLVIPLFDIVVFGTLAAAAIRFRRRPEVHKRLMLLATIGLMAAPIARLSLQVLRYGPPAFFGLADLFVVACLGYDIVSRRRVQPATAWGAAFVVASQPFRLWLGGTTAWLTFASWITR
jgi:FtsH-binding integral membrane protein